MLSRNQQNYYIMTAIYNELEDFNYGNKEVVRQYDEVLANLLDVDKNLVPAFVLDMVSVSLSSYGEIVDAISPLLKNWSWERIPLLTQAILLMSYTRFYKVDKADKKIVINIAVELAKTYIEEKQAKFINAILDKLLK